VYDMNQAYLVMLTGKNCASPEAWNDFRDKWKLAEIYIAKEYTPNEFVNRMHKQFYSNATAIMQPGTHGSKPIPFVITMSGKPGMGKSTAWPVLVSGIVPGNVQQIRALSYTRNPVSDFFDGYNPEKHKIFVYDDFGSQVDDAAAGELMSIVSNADYLPPLASLNDPNIGLKGSSFSSPIVILCSNFEEFNHCKQVADKTALLRRLGYVVKAAAKIKPDSMLGLFKMRIDGTQEPVQNTKRKSEGYVHNYFGIRDLQEFFAKAYKEHMIEQLRVNEDLNQLCMKDHDYTFRKFTPR